MMICNKLLILQSIDMKLWDSWLTIAYRQSNGEMICERVVPLFLPVHNT